MKLDSIFYQFIEVKDKLPTLLSTGAHSSSVSITDLPKFQSWLLLEDAWQLKNLEVHDSDVEGIDSGTELKLNRRSK